MNFKEYFLLKEEAKFYVFLNTSTGKFINRPSFITPNNPRGIIYYNSFSPKQAYFHLKRKNNNFKLTPIKVVPMDIFVQKYNNNQSILSSSLPVGSPVQPNPKPHNPQLEFQFTP